MVNSRLGLVINPVTSVICGVYDERARCGIEGATPPVMKTFAPFMPTMHLAGETNRPMKRIIKEIGQ
jgi:hypothetical protein